MTMGEIALAHRAIDALDRIERAIVGGKDDKWKQVAQAIALCLEARGKEATLTEHEIDLLLQVARLGNRE